MVRGRLTRKQETSRPNIEDYWNVDGEKECQMHGQALQEPFY